METTTPQKLHFHGTGAALFGIQFVNILLTIVTLGLYYPWAKAATLRYMYQETDFLGTRFVFHGTGKEMFWGFIKAAAIIIALYSVYFAGIFLNNITLIIVGTVLLFGGLLLLMPMIIHGGMRYRMSRTSWRSIHFGYRGNLKALMFLFWKNVLLTIVTLGIYGSWMEINLRQYIIGSVRFGNVKFNYQGNGLQLFMIHFRGIFLSIITLGIYFFWYTKSLFNYYIDNIQMEQEDRIIKLESSATGGGFFGVMITNIFIILFTLGLGAPWATVRVMNYILSNINIGEGFNPEILLQTEENYTNALGEDMMDALDLDLV